MSGTRRYCGRQFTPAEIDTLRALIAEHPEASRAQLSRLVCERLGWRAPDGRLKQMICRVAMLRMQADALLELPAPRTRNGNAQAYRRRTPQAEPPLFPLDSPAGALPDLHLEPVRERRCSHLWNEYIDRYHYLGYQPLPGAQLRYFARAGGEVLALLGFGAAACTWWSTMPAF